MLNIIDYQINSEMNKLKELLSLYKYKEVVLFCAGNYKIWYDNFAPIFADKLRQSSANIFIYGGEKYPITAENIVEYMDFIDNKHPNACVIVIDNVISFDQNEKLIVKQNGSFPSGFTNIRKFGDISILLKTNYLGNYIYHNQLQNKIQIYLLKIFEKMHKKY